MGHSLLVNTKETDNFHIEGEDIGDIDCCIKTCASRYVHACPPKKFKQKRATVTCLCLFFLEYMYRPACKMHQTDKN